MTQHLLAGRSSTGSAAFSGACALRRHAATGSSPGSTRQVHISRLPRRQVPHVTSIVPQVGPKEQERQQEQQQATYGSELQQQTQLSDMQPQASQQAERQPSLQQPLQPPQGQESPQQQQQCQEQHQQPHHHHAGRKHKATPPAIGGRPLSRLAAHKPLSYNTVSVEELLLPAQQAQPDITHPQQVQQQPHQQQASQGWQAASPSTEAAPAAAAARGDGLSGARRPPEALAAELCGVVHSIPYGSEQGSYRVLKFKQLSHCSNVAANPKRHDWRPADEDAAQAALTSATSRSRQTSSNSSSSDMSGWKQWRTPLLAVTGDLPACYVGHAYRITGQWDKHPRHGWHIKAATCEEDIGGSDTLAVLQRMPGIGQARAKALVQHFGASMEAIQQVLDLPRAEAVQKLAQVRSIPKTCATAMKDHWDEMQGEMQRRQQLQQKFGLPAALVIKLLDSYGDEVEQQLSSNPYAFYRKVPGYTIDDAERVAATLGFDPGAPERAGAYLQTGLLYAATESFCGLTWHVLQDRVLQELARQSAVLQVPGWPQGQGLRQAAEQLVQEGVLVVEHIQVQAADSSADDSQLQQQQVVVTQLQEGWPNDAVVMLKELHDGETAFIDCVVSAAEACHAALQQLLQQAQTLQGSKGRGRSRLRTSTSSSGGGGGAVRLLLPMELRPEEVKLLQAISSELSEDLGQPVQFNEGQQTALVAALRLPVLVLTGGPGCGKTLISQGIARAWLSCRDTKLCSFRNANLNMAAPTGRAAQRLQELVRRDTGAAVQASTIHRLLRYRSKAVPKADAAAAAVAPDLSIMFEYGSGNKLPPANTLVDEVSMMDTPLASALFSALQSPDSSAYPETSVLLVGDTDQLPPVGPGRPMAAALAEGLLPCIDLRRIYRTAANSSIVQSAHAINAGAAPSFDVWDLRPGSIAADLQRHIAASSDAAGKLQLPSNALLLRLPDYTSEDDVSDAVMQAATSLLPNLTHDIQLDVQVLSPIKGSSFGTESLNAKLQPLFNPRLCSDDGRAEMTLSSSSGSNAVWRVGDRVTHLKNDTDLDVYNGDQGYIESIDVENQVLTVRYPPRSSGSGSRRGSSTNGGSNSSSSWESADSGGGDGGAWDEAGFHFVTYQVADIREKLQLAWATTVHKAQGGEFPIVLIPLHKRAGSYLLRRQLLYTAVTRAKQQLVVVSTQQAIDACVHSVGVPDAAAGDDQSRLQLKLRAARQAAGLPTFQRAVFGAEGAWL